MSKMSKVPPAILPKSNLRSLFDSLIIFQPVAGVWFPILTRSAHSTSNVELEFWLVVRESGLDLFLQHVCVLGFKGAGTRKETTDLSTKIIFICASDVIGVEENTHQERQIFPRPIGDRVRGTCELSSYLKHTL